MTSASSDAEHGSSGIRRRTIILGGVAGVVSGMAFSAPAVAAASPIPLLPYEVSRTETRVTRQWKKAYECIDIDLAGDRARLFVPHATPPGTSRAAGVTWFYHSTGSNHTAIDGAYKYGAEMAVDRGAVCICPDYGGDLWTSQAAITRQQNMSTYMSTVWRVGVSFLRANSGGGALMTYAYGARLVPAVRGMYLANAAYDTEDLFQRDPARVAPPYGNDLATVQATNPARLPQSSWAGTRMKIVVSSADTIMPPERHGLALAATARPVATQVTVAYHDGGHVVPSWTQADMITTFAAWL